MKIAILGLRGLPSSYSGYETFIGELAPRLVARGYEVTIYCRSALFPNQPDRYRGCHLIYLPCIEHKLFSTLSHTLLAILQASLSEADLILVVNAANGLFGWIPRLFGKTAVLNVDGMEWLRPKWNPLAQFVFKNSARLGCLFYPAIVTDADEMHRIYAREFGIDSTYIAYGANLETSEHPEFLQEYGLTPNEYYFAAGRLIPDNNADLLIAGFVASGSPKTLAIAGAADYAGNRAERRYFTRLQSLASDRVKFLGHIDQPGHFRELQANCYGYLHAHQYGGINPSLLQALGRGACVLALDTPFNQEALDHGRYGLFFEKTPTDVARALRLADAHPNLVATFRHRAPTRITERFTWAQITTEYERLFTLTRTPGS